MPVISVRDLVVEYEGRRVLNKLNLDIEAGETMVLADHRARASEVGKRNGQRR